MLFEIKNRVVFSTFHWKKIYFFSVCVIYKTDLVNLLQWRKRWKKRYKNKYKRSNQLSSLVPTLKISSGYRKNSKLASLEATKWYVPSLASLSWLLPRWVISKTSNISVQKKVYQPVWNPLLSRFHKKNYLIATETHNITKVLHNVLFFWSFSKNSTGLT